MHRAQRHQKLKMGKNRLDFPIDIFRTGNNICASGAPDALVIIRSGRTYALLCCAVTLLWPTDEARPDKQRGTHRFGMIPQGLWNGELIWVTGKTGRPRDPSFNRGSS